MNPETGRTETGRTESGIEDLWQRMHRQLAQLADQLEAGFERSDKARYQQYLERARQWAIPEPAAETETPLEVLAFELCGETYAVEARYVVEARPLQGYTAIPSLPEFVPGIVNVRGRVVSVLDLRRLFALPQRGLSDLNHLVVLRNAEMEFGLLTDRLLGVEPLWPRDLVAELANLDGVRRAYLLGISNRQWVVLDAEKLLGDPQLRINYAAESGNGG